MSEQRLDYKSAGVNIATGDEASHIMFAAARQTWSNRQEKLGEVHAAEQHFRTARYFHGASEVNDIVFGMNADGIGTKIELAERLQTYTTLGSDLLAMICDDAAINGGEPLHVTTVLDMARIDLTIVRELAQGLVEAANKAGVAVLNGETAELQGRVGGFGSAPLNWAGTCLWAARLSTLRRLAKAQPGDSVIAVEERGFRSNGFSLIRAIFRRAFGETWTATSASADLVRFALQPSVIYTPLLLSLTGGVSGHAIEGLRACVNVTGGGLAGRLKFFRKIHHFGMDLSFTAFGPPDEMREVCALGAVALEELSASPLRSSNDELSASARPTAHSTRKDVRSRWIAEISSAYRIHAAENPPKRSNVSAPPRTTRSSPSPAKSTSMRSRGNAPPTKGASTPLAMKVSVNIRNERATIADDRLLLISRSSVAAASDSALSRSSSSVWMRGRSSRKGAEMEVMRYRV
jgi:phosphoribosylformylglycinamidine cyclo-ligase